MCPITHGAILRWNVLSSTRWLMDTRNFSELISAPPATFWPSSSGEADPPLAISRHGAVPASTTKPAAMNKKTQSMRRSRSDPETCFKLVVTVNPIKSTYGCGGGVGRDLGVGVDPRRGVVASGRACPSPRTRSCKGCRRANLRYRHCCR